MKKTENGRLDRFAFALGSVTLATPFIAVPVVPNDRINRAWDSRLAERDAGSESDLEQAPVSCTA